VLIAQAGLPGNLRYRHRPDRSCICSRLSFIDCPSDAPCAWLYCALSSTQTP
jgi:hypothetical protein